jgi:hypothetical protein
MEYHDLVALRQKHPAWRLLVADHAPLIVGFLFETHRQLWVREEAPFRGPLMRLESDERELFEALVHNRLGDGIRLEQERVSFGRVRQAMQEIAIAASRA